jgi:hypothetical protein
VEECKMAKYRVTMMEKTYYEIYVEANNPDEAEEKAIKDFGNGGGEVTDSYIDYIETEEETE